MQKFQFRLVVLLSILMLLSLSLAQFGQGRRGQQQDNRQRQQSGLSNSLETVFENARASAVRIETSPAGIGSGFVISADGGILTAYHVLQNASSVNVVFDDGSRYRAALVGFDEYQDVALLDIDATNLTPLSIDFSNTPEIGETLLAIGNSRGQFNAARAGRLFALNQFLDVAFPESLVGSTLPLAPGDSGGPILNSSGDVIGVAVAASRARNASLGFAAPLYGRPASELIANLQTGTQRGVPYLGVSLLEVTAEATAQLGYDQLQGQVQGQQVQGQQVQGLMITNVAPNSGADLAGLQNPDIEQTIVRTGRGNRESAITQINQADIITSVNNRTVSSFDDLLVYIRSLQVGDVVMLGVLRNGSTVEVPVTLGMRSHF